MRLSTYLAALAAACLLGGCVPPDLTGTGGSDAQGGGNNGTDAGTNNGTNNGPVQFTQVAGLVRDKCAISTCHGPQSFQAFQVANGQSASDADVQAALEADSTMVVAGDPASSKFYKVLVADGVPMMPTTGKLPDAQISMVKRWIEQGASYE